MPKRSQRPDLLDELAPLPTEPAPLARTPAPARGERRAVVKIRESVADQARAAVLFLQGHGHPAATLAGYVEEAVQERLARDRDQLNGGEAFPPVSAQLRPGRRIGG